MPEAIILEDILNVASCFVPLFICYRLDSRHIVDVFFADVAIQCAFPPKMLCSVAAAVSFAGVRGDEAGRVQAVAGSDRSGNDGNQDASEKGDRYLIDGRFLRFEKPQRSPSVH